jgi:hypothetical protein
VTALFNFYNRLVDGVGLALPEGYVAEADNGFRPKDTMSSPNLRRRNNPLPTGLIVQSLRRDHKQPQHRLRQSWSCH